jgi:vacuolar-type H+-ATPase subunit H
MKVLELLDEIEEICETSSSMPLISNKIVVDKAEMIEIVKEVRQALPDEIEQAKFIKNERQRILEEAKQEYELLIKDAEKQAEAMVEQHEITEQARARAQEIMNNTEAQVKKLKMNTFEYIDGKLGAFQQLMTMLDGKYFQDLVENLQQAVDGVAGDKQQAFAGIAREIEDNRREIQDLVYRTNAGSEL